LGIREDSLRLAEVNAPRQLPHYHQVDPRDHLWLQGGSPHQLREDFYRAQVGKQPQPRPQAQQGPLRAFLRRQSVILEVADSSQINGIALLSHFQGFCRQGIPGLVVGSPAD